MLRDHICKYTAFDMVIFLTKPLPKSKVKEASDILQANSLSDLLDYCVENGCFNKEQAVVMEAFIMMFEGPGSNYWENHPENYARLLDAIGLTSCVLGVCMSYDEAVADTKPLPKNKIKKGRMLLESGMDGLNNLLSLCVENDCISDEQMDDIYRFADEFEELDGECSDMSGLSYASFLEAVRILETKTANNGKGC